MEILKNHLELTFTEEEYHKKWIEYHQWFLKSKQINE
jgi:hypothetical protein